MFLIVFAEESKAADSCNEKSSEPNCIVCMERPPNTILLECGHSGVCEACATRLWGSGRRCPLCRELFAAVMRVVEEADDVVSWEKLLTCWLIIAKSWQCNSVLECFFRRKWSLSSTTRVWTSLFCRVYPPRTILWAPLKPIRRLRRSPSLKWTSLCFGLNPTHTSFNLLAEFQRNQFTCWIPSCREFHSFVRARPRTAYDSYPMFKRAVFQYLLQHREINGQLIRLSQEVLSFSWIVKSGSQHFFFND